MCTTYFIYTVRYRANRTATDYIREKIYCVRREMPGETRGPIMINWLLHPTGEVPLVRQLMIATIKLVMFPHGHDTHMHGGLTYVVKSMEIHRRVFS